MTVWIFFEDGPCGGPGGGGGLGCERLPTYLRAVKRPRDGKIDALDGLDDVPADDEDVYVYRLHSIGHLNTGNRATSGRMGMYRHVPDVDVDRARDTDDWRSLAEELQALAEWGF